MVNVMRFLSIFGLSLILPPKHTRKTLIGQGFPLHLNSFVAYHTSVILYSAYPVPILNLYSLLFLPPGSCLLGKTLYSGRILYLNHLDLNYRTVGFTFILESEPNDLLIHILLGSGSK